MGSARRSRRSFAWLRAGCWAFCALSCTCSRAQPESEKSTPASVSSGSSATSPVPAAPALVVGNTGPGAFELRAARPVQVATVAQLEQRAADGSWLPDPIPAGSPGYLLAESCPLGAPATCRSLSAGETLVPVPWSGEDCGWQCGKPCERDARFLSGVHRLVVTGCAAPHERFEGPPFEMPRTAKALARQRAATGVDHVRAARLERTGFKQSSDGDEPGRIAGYKEISGTSRELSPELTAELLQWLRAEAGFEDNILRRCEPGLGVGFVLTRKAPNSPPRSDIGLDLGCSALDIIESGREISFSYFDPSREQLFGILSRAFPNDRQLKHEIAGQLSAIARVKSQPTQPRVGQSP